MLDQAPYLLECRFLQVLGRDSMGRAVRRLRRRQNFDQYRYLREWSGLLHDPEDERILRGG